MDNYPFVVQPELTAIALAIANDQNGYIADQVLPRVSVGSQLFKYSQWTTRESFTIPETMVGRKGRVNEVDFTASETEASTSDYGLEDPIPQSDINAAANNPAIDPLGHATARLTDLILMDREKRVADLVFTYANHVNKSTLSGTTQWSHASSTPLTAIETAINTPLMRPNIMVLGQEVWTALRMHADIVSSVQHNSGTKGRANLGQVAELFELDEIIVGRSRNQTANRGQTAAYARLWGKHAVLAYRSSSIATDMATFGFTGEWGTRVAGSWEDKNIGLRGGTRVRVGESVKELIVSTDCSYMFLDAAA